MAEFKIGRLRFTWKGAWNDGVTYNRDAVVSFAGKTYVCLQPHTSSVDFYGDLDYVTPAGEIQPRWDLMIDGNQWIGNWTPNTPYSIGNIVVYGGAVYKCIVPNISGPSTINLANWVLYTVVDSTWIGIWLPLTLYKKGSVVKYGGIVYRCLVEHTSLNAVSGLEASLALSKWEIVDAGIEYKGAWEPLTRYKENDLVKESSNVWICTQGHTSSVAIDFSNWDLWLEGLSFEGGWSSSFLYQLGDVIVYGGYSYVSKVSDNLNLIPPANTSEWELLTTGYELKSDWENSNNYKVGDVVRRGGNLFVATADNSTTDPSVGTNTGNGYITTTCTSSTDLEIGVASVTNLRVGMYVLSAAGTTQSFAKGQTITEIVDSFTIKISEAPDVDPTGKSLDFTGVNANWDLLTPGIRWRNRWEESTDYVVGDIVVWINVTYKCINTHTSTTTAPSEFTNDHVWLPYLLHDTFNVLNLPGDVVVNSNGDNQSLEIGAEGFLLKSVNGIPTWSNVFQTPGVFYVTPDGTDLPGSGTTWDNPYQSIKYACEQVMDGIYNPVAKQALIDNKEFIVEEAASWQVYQISNSIGVFAGKVIDPDKTKRDARFFIDGIIYDISRGGNSQTVGNALAYFDLEAGNKFSNSVVQTQILAFIATLNKIRDLLENILDGVIIAPVFQTVVAQTPVLGTVENGIIDRVTALGDIVVSALTDKNTSGIPPANQGATATVMVKTGTYKESLPIVVPANTAIVGDELRGTVVQPKVVINTVATRSKRSTNTFVVGTTVGMTDNTPIQFVSANPVDGTNTVFGGVTAGVTYYVIGSTITSTEFSISADPTIQVPIELVNFVSTMKVYGGDALSNMFYVRNGSGIRNMTLSGLLGTLTAQNAFLTRRPTGGTFVSLDPGTGPDDTSAWITTRSPYMQNVTNFGIGCVGMKIDGTLHNGGNKSCVSNDFTQILSDGIGIWCTGPDALTEAVSVFSYYNYTGYLAEDGGRIRATNGNSSYGTFGCIAEGFDANESPITATINNRFYQAAATPLNSLGTNASILALQYNHAGEGYTSATTNLLAYSNVFTNWASDGNVTLVQSFVSPSGQSDGWYAEGNTSGSNSSYFYQNITVAPSGASYTALSADSQTGGGIGATFDVVVTSTQYIVSVNGGGTGYVATNELTINGSQLGGITGINDLTITVSGLINGTEIQTITSSGVVPAGSTQPYTFSVFCKKGTATDFQVDATFSGNSSVTSSISYNFASGIITATATNGGMTPTQYQAIPVSSAPGWYRLYFTFNDSNALNDSLQIRFYPRGKTGNTAYTLLYGSQLEVGSNLGFYLKTTTNRFTSYANFDIVGAGTGVDVVGDEIRVNSVIQTRILSSLGYTGGNGYLLSTNNAQTGTDTTITIAASDIAANTAYLGMRLFVNSGTGAGQYGVIAAYDSVSKIANILKESFVPITITATDNGTRQFSITGNDDINSLYVNQPVQFVPTNYNIIVDTVSQNSLPISVITGGTTNTITVPSTVRLTVNMPITFSGTSFGGITSDYTYYIANIIDDTHIQVSLTYGGAVLLLNTETGVLDLNYPSNTSYLSTLSTTNMDVTLPIYFTGTLIGGVQPATTYYINDVIDSSNFTISATLLTTTATATTVVTNRITVDASTGMVPLTPIILRGTTFGGVTAGQKYYVNQVVDVTHITIASTLITTTATSTVSSGNLITVASTAGFVIGNPVVFSGTTFGNLINERVYYVLYVNNSTSFTVSSTSTLLQFNVTGTTITSNLVAVSAITNITPLNPVVFSGTGGGGLAADTTYYVSRIPDSGHIVVSSSILSTVATTTADISNLITVGSTAGFVVNNPIVFGGPSIGGLVAGQVYFISAINDSVSFTVSASSGGSAVTLSAATGGNMTVRTTGADVTLSTASVTLTGTTTYGGSAVVLTNATGSVITKTTGSVLPLTTASGTMSITTTAAKQSLSAASGSMTGTFTVPILGDVVQGTTYYIGSVTSGATNVFTLDTDLVGTPFTPTSSSGSMSMGEVGWDHINPGTPSVVSFDASTVYSIEPKITYSAPAYTAAASSIVNQASGTTYIDIKYGNGLFVAIANNDATIAYSSTGITWNPRSLPSSATWSSIAYGNSYWVIISNGGSGSGSKVLYSNSNLVTWKTSYLPSIGNWSKVAYGNGKFVAITNDSASSASSSDWGANWTSMSGLSSTTWASIAYGAGKFVAIGTNSRIAAYSTNGTSWTTITLALPVTSAWTSVTFGKGRFVAVSAAGIPPAYSTDGITWASALYAVAADAVAYGGGAFVAVSSGNAQAYSSDDGIRWKIRSTSASTVGALTYGFNDAYDDGLFVTVGGRTNSTVIRTGATTKARVSVTAGVIKKIYEWETGAYYTNPPTITIIDSNATVPASVVGRLGNGALADPTFINTGTGYYSATTSITITGNGYADDYQTGLSIIVNNLTRLPRAGDNLAVNGNSTIYKVTDAVALNGTVSPSILARIQISPEMSVEKSPAHAEIVTVRTKYSQVRLTNHDFLNVGYGNFEQSNYPLTPPDTTLAPQSEIVENNYGRAFFSSTDQDGNFRVGNLFAVEQATGIVTLSASQFGLTGLNQLKLGGVSVGNASVIITQFSTDSTFVANSDKIIPTQKAIRAYLTARLSQGGSNTFTGQLTAGTVVVGAPDKITSTVPAGNEGSVINIPVVANIHGMDGGGVDGNAMAHAFFTYASSRR